MRPSRGGRGQVFTVQVGVEPAGDKKTADSARSAGRRQPFQREFRTLDCPNLYPGGADVIIVMPLGGESATLPRHT